MYNSNMSILVDWLTMTGEAHSFAAVIKKLGLGSFINEFEPVPGANFYLSGMKWLGIKIFRGQKRGNDFYPNAVMIDITGKGCRQLEQYTDIEVVIEYFRNHGWSCSRIDLAYDLIGEFPKLLPQLVADTRADNYVCRSNFRNIQDSKFNGIHAYSLYFGKQCSDLFINIYDKRAERGYSPEDMPCWTRIECRFRGKNALKVFLNLNYKNQGEIFSGYLNRYIRFVVPNKYDTNKRRWNTCNYWSDVIDTAANIDHLYQPGVAYDFSKFEDSFITACGSRIYTYLQMHSLDDLINAIADHDVKINQYQKELLRFYNQYGDLSYVEVSHDTIRDGQAVQLSI